MTPDHIFAVLATVSAAIAGKAVEPYAQWAFRWARRRYLPALKRRWLALAGGPQAAGSGAAR